LYVLNEYFYSNTLKTSII